MDENPDKIVMCRHLADRRLCDDEYAFHQQRCEICNKRQECKGPTVYVSGDIVVKIASFIRGGLRASRDGGVTYQCLFCGSHDTDTSRNVIHGDECVGVRLSNIFAEMGA